jgi:hypothetical protein
MVVCFDWFFGSVAFNLGGRNCSGGISHVVKSWKPVIMKKAV